MNTTQQDNPNTIITYAIPVPGTGTTYHIRPVHLLVVLLGGVTVIFACAGMMLTVMVAAGGYERLTGVDLPDMPMLETTEEVRVDQSQTIAAALDAKAELITAEQPYSITSVNVQINKGIINRCYHQAWHSVEGAVQAGVDLAGIDAGAVSYNARTDTYTLTVPRTEVLHCTVRQSEQYRKSFVNTLCGVRWDDLRRIAEHSAIDQFGYDAVSDDQILLRAEENAETAIHNLLAGMTDSAIVIAFTGESQSAETACSGERPLPGDYYYAGNGRYALR